MYLLLKYVQRVGRYLAHSLFLQSRQEQIVTFTIISILQRSRRLVLRIPLDTLPIGDVEKIGIAANDLLGNTVVLKFDMTELINDR